MATRDSEQRRTRRFHQRFRETVEASPGFQAAVRARLRHRRRHPYAAAPSRYLRALCVQWGRELGGRPYTKAYRCTKRLGTRLCWNWRVEGTTRCYRHQQEVSA
jgi:hypothetical protein